MAENTTLTTTPENAFPFTEDQWKDLLYAFRSGNCVVLTGSGLAVKTVDGTTRPLTEWLALHLSDKLSRGGVQLDAEEKKNLYYTATIFLRKKGYNALQNEIEDFYKDNEREVGEMHQLISQLPVSLIINSSPDVLLARAFRQGFREVRSLYYSLNRDRKSGKEQLSIEDPSRDSPLIYNLLGSIKDTDSLVLTEKDQLRFLEDVIQHNNAIPNTVLKHLGEKKVYLFFGYDFERWQLRILLRLLRLSESHLSPVLAPNDGGNLSRNALIFFQHQYRLEFPDIDSKSFLREILRRWETYEETLHDGDNGQRTPLEVLYLYHEADATLKTQLDNHLAVLRNHKAIHTWDESQLLPGEEIGTTLGQRLESANLILFLVSADSLASQRLYEGQLRRALQRQRNQQAVLCPILVRPCSWEKAIFSKLPTLLPRNKKPVQAWEQPEEALRHIAKQLEKFVEMLLENLN